VGLAVFDFLLWTFQQAWEQLLQSETANKPNDDSISCTAGCDVFSSSILFLNWYRYQFRNWYLSPLLPQLHLKFFICSNFIKHGARLLETIAVKCRLAFENWIRNLHHNASLLAFEKKDTVLIKYTHK
jgi:hypothetical protein